MTVISRADAGKFAKLDKAPELVVRALQMSELTASRMCWTESESGTPFQFERKNGYMVCLHRRPLPSSPCWIDGRAITRKPMNRGQFLLLDRNRNHEALTYGGAVDCISIYTSREAIDRFLEEHEVRSSGLLRTPEGLAFDDNVIESLGEALVPALEQPNAASQLFVDYIALALLARLAEFYGEDPAVARQIRGGLAHWQERRAKEALMAHIDGKIGLVDLARETGLSRSHFARAFRQTTGMPPHKWLQVRRIELAQDLLRNSTLPVEKIAVRCGFIDQSHMTRTFTKAVGMPPGEWRRSFR